MNPLQIAIMEAQEMSKYLTTNNQGGFIMKQKTKKMLAGFAALAVCTNIAASLTASASYGVGGNGTAIMEYLDRGIYAVKSGSGMFISWRFNANDDDNAEFRLYRDNQLIYTSRAGDATSYQDNGGSQNSKYRVDTVVNGAVVSAEECKFNSGANYFDIPLNNPGNGYSPNDCSVGDVDGDGQYEIIMKWDPNNAVDNSQSGITGNVYIDCYTLTGQQLWRIDLGQNIRAGQHYTQLCVADFDCDGKAEFITKTADGTVDGTGRVIGNASKTYRNPSGYILDGPEFMTLFDGETGAAIDTIDFPVPRGNVSQWGDGYGNRVDRFNSAIAYLDGVHPSAVYGRGYYTRMTLSAVDVVDKKLSVRWIFDSGFNSSAPGFADGNHNVMVADVDDDGRQEICMGSTMIDDNGKLLWCNENGHGDAMHLGDLIPERPGLELWMCHEHAPYGVSLIDARTGSTIFRKNGDKDTGRACGDNIWAGSPGAELWGARPANAVLNTKGDTIATKQPSMNYLIYWDGDLERELLNDTTISKMTGVNQIQTLLNAEGCSSNNSTKAVPCMTADLFGDWREELLMRTSDNNKLRIWCATAQTKVRLTTLMHDMQYRMQNGCQQSAYNQPPHVSYFLGSDAALPERPDVVINGSSTGGASTTPGSVDTSKIYAMRNLNSGLYLSADGGNAVQQPDSGSAENLWQFVGTGDGCYTITNIATGDVLTLDTGNMTVTSASGADAQQFILYRSGSGYVIATKTSESANCVEVKDALTNEGANVQEWERNGHNCQVWVLEAMSYHPAKNPYLVGDMNGDDRVNAVDLALMKRAMIGGQADRVALRPADTNADGIISVADAVAMQKHLLGQDGINRSYHAAIDAAYMSGVEESTNAGFRNTAYVNLDNQVGSFLEFRVYAPKAGTYSCTLGTANGSAVNRIMQISVNGGAAFAQDFESTGAWTTWTDTTLNLTLTQGINTIRLVSDTEQGGPNIDYLIMERSN